MKSSIAKINPREILFSRKFVHAKFSTFKVLGTRDESIVGVSFNVKHDFWMNLVYLNSFLPSIGNLTDWCPLFLLSMNSFLQEIKQVNQKKLYLENCKFWFVFGNSSIYQSGTHTSQHDSGQHCEVFYCFPERYSPGAMTWTCTKILSGIFLLISFLETL